MAPFFASFPSRSSFIMLGSLVIVFLNAWAACTQRVSARFDQPVFDADDGSVIYNDPMGKLKISFSDVFEVEKRAEDGGEEKKAVEQHVQQAAPRLTTRLRLRGSELYRFITATFVHQSIDHLQYNLPYFLPVLFVIDSVLPRPHDILLLFFLIGACGWLLSLAVLHHKAVRDQHPFLLLASSCGASPAIYGLLAFATVACPNVDGGRISALLGVGGLAVATIPEYRIWRAALARKPKRSSGARASGASGASSSDHDASSSSSSKCGSSGATLHDHISFALAIAYFVAVCLFFLPRAFPSLPGSSYFFSSPSTAELLSSSSSQAPPASPPLPPPPPYPVSTPAMWAWAHTAYRVFRLFKLKFELGSCDSASHAGGVIVGPSRLAAHCCLLRACVRS